MEMFFILGLFLVAIGVFLGSIEEKKFRNGNLISCTDRDEVHKWRWNAFGDLECSVCYKIAGRSSEEEEQ